MSHQQMQPEGLMICSLIKELHREEKEVNYKILPNLLVEKHHVCMPLFIMNLRHQIVIVVRFLIFFCR